MANRFLSNITINDQYTLPSSDGTDGQILSTTGAADGTTELQFIDQGDIIAGEADKALSLTLRVKNTESVALTKGQVVCAAPTATPPSGNVIEIKLADNNGINSMPAIGILNEDLDAAGGENDEGQAIMFGRVSGINTSAFSVGDEVFVSDTPGALTATKPTGVKYIQKVGVIMRDDASNGTIEVFGAGRTNDVPTPLYVDHANQRLGIGVEDPDYKLHIDASSGGFLKVSESGTDRLTLDSNNELWLTAPSNWGGHFKVGKDVGPYSVTMELGEGRTSNGYTIIDLVGDIHYTDYGFRIIRNNTGQNTTSQLVHRGTGNFELVSTDSGDIILNPNNGKVGIGTTDPQEKLHIHSTGSGPVRAEIESTAATDAILKYTNSVRSYATFLTQNGSFSIYDYNAAEHRFYMLTNGNIGIGTINPGYKIDVVNTDSDQTTLDSLTFRARSENYAGTVAAFENSFGTNTSIRISDTVDDMYVVSRNGIMGLGPIGGWSSTNLNIKSNGYVGIGQRSPADKLHVKGGNIRVDSGGWVRFFINSTTQRGYVGPTGEGGNLFAIGSDYKIVFNTAGTEKMRLTDDGRLLLNTPDDASATNSRFEVVGNSAIPSTNMTFKTSGRLGLGTYNPDAKIHIIGTTGGSASNLVKIENTSNTGPVIDFRNSAGVQAGLISMPTSTTVNYGTISDYRLKTNVVSLQNGINRVKKLKPSRFEWVNDGTVVDGFIAHEVSEVIPEAINGEKDAVDENNNPTYQTIDQSKIIPVLTAALQEAISKIEQLETRIQTLENN